MTDTLEHEVRAEHRDGVRWLILDRPSSRNGLTVPVARRMSALLAEAAADATVRALVVYGASGAFCSGADIKAAMSMEFDVETSLSSLQDFNRALYHLPKPTVAAIDGAAAGFGADIALACDVRLATEGSKLGQRFVGIGLMPDGGGTFLLPRIVGQGRALELIYSGRMVDAAEGERIGLFNAVQPAVGFREAVQVYAAALAAGPPMAYATSKLALQRSFGDFDAALAVEAEHQLKLLASGDFTEGVQAFLMKRKPEFQGR